MDFFREHEKLKYFVWISFREKCKNLRIFIHLRFTQIRTIHDNYIVDYHNTFVLGFKKFLKHGLLQRNAHSKKWYISLVQKL